MRQVFSEGHPLAKEIRAIRARLRKSGVEFGEMLGVNQAMVSRYEAGKTRPGYLVLGRLLDLAKGAERNPILDQLARLLDMKKVHPTEAEVLAEYQKAMRGCSLPQSRDGWRVLDEYRAFAPNLADLAIVLKQIFSRGREVDASVVNFVQLWLVHDDTDPAVRKCFADAAMYLEIALAIKANETKK